jgi:putative endonuclease
MFNKGGWGRSDGKAVAAPKGRAMADQAPPAAATQAHLAAGAAAEARALAHLQAQGLVLLARNYRVARGRSARAGEIDLVMRDRDGTLVFVEVRARRSGAQGGAAASIGHGKRQKLIFAAQHYLLRFNTLPPCRFDVVALDGEQLQWLKAAFDAA